MPIPGAKIVVVVRVERVFGVCFVVLLYDIDSSIDR